MRARRALLVSDAEIAAVRVEVVPGAAHPTVHERGLPRRPEFAQAIRRWIAK
jgi:alpha-beta hydrolase superfamily lysophospholipase